jgi:drug/metabolite transporter (DMT)-like permease
MKTRKRNIFSWVSSSFYLWTAILIFAAANAVTRKITEIGAQHLVDGRNPISLCNVLFVGNLCALAMMLLIFGRELNQRTLRQLTRGDWISLGVIAILSGALGPGLIFGALDNTTVTNVVLIGRLEPPLTLALSIWLIGVRVNTWTIAGAIASFVGVAVTSFLPSSGQTVALMGGSLHIGNGELMAAAGAVILAVATVISKLRLQHIPLGFFNIFRTALGTVVFFFLAQFLYGTQHFQDAFSRFLWQWMLLYGAVIVVAGQLCWFAGLRGSTSAQITLANSFNPIAAIVMAYLILGEVPTAAQYMGGSIILIGIVLSLIGSIRSAKAMQISAQISPAKQMGSASGFMGI